MTKEHDNNIVGTMDTKTGKVFRWMAGVSFGIILLAIVGIISIIKWIF